MPKPKHKPDTDTVASPDVQTPRRKRRQPSENYIPLSMEELAQRFFANATPPDPSRRLPRKHARRKVGPT